jgi:hypothetical protein
MRYQAVIDEALGETRIELSSNCYTDAFPMVRSILFRKQDIDLKSQSLPLACAILTSKYCGDHFEFVGMRIGNDYADAIRSVLGPSTNIAGVDGHQRAIAVGEVDIFSARATLDRHEPPQRPGDTVAYSETTWSGDFVSRDTRNSAGHVTGAYWTNAELFADEDTVSVAVALIHGRDRCRTVYVPGRSGGAASRMEPIQDALFAVSVGLEIV